MTFGKIVLAVVTLTVVGCGADGESASDPAADSTAASSNTTELSATRTALEFLDERNAWDGPGLRALVADDAVVADFAVDSPDDYLAMAMLERTLQWQYLDPECTATVSGEDAHVRCTYVMQNRLSQATGTGPDRGSRIDFEISDGLIEMVTNTFDHARYGPHALEPYSAWLDAEHPGDSDVMFFINDLGEVNRSLSPESLALWAEHVPEYVAVQGAG